MKKHKSTYAARRELRFRSLPPEDVALLDPMVQHIVEQNRLLVSVAKDQQLKVTSSQSLLEKSLGPQEAHPLYTRICLSKDWDERRETLMAVRQRKLKSAYDFLMAPGRFVDPDKPHVSDHRFETSEGDICCVHSEATHFRGVQSLEKVWEAVLFHYNNIEIDISERLGHTTVRDDYDSIDGSVSNIRILSHSESCIAVESSIVTFSQLFFESDDEFNRQPVGILALDCIDEDELYPYFPDKRVRLDTSGAIVLTVSKKNDSGAGGMVVTLRRAAFVKLHNPVFPISEVTRQELQTGIGRWGDVLMKTIRSYVYGNP
ncbi:unnamed protein product [Phytophthora lilii]|uniref:Unnamed protein product n=1 Tax=Phytophthora lilii TaxID=2077276 RepID=A0A9W6U348_9STRA|nr:unnamed protein product [Phytophthora lilii]